MHACIGNDSHCVLPQPPSASPTVPRGASAVYPSVLQCSLAQSPWFNPDLCTPVHSGSVFRLHCRRSSYPTMHCSIHIPFRGMFILVAEAYMTVIVVHDSYSSVPKHMHGRMCTYVTLCIQAKVSSRLSMAVTGAELEPDELIGYRSTVWILESCFLPAGGSISHWKRSQR